MRAKIKPLGRRQQEEYNQREDSRLGALIYRDHSRMDQLSYE